MYMFSIPLYDLERFIPAKLANYQHKDTDENVFADKKKGEEKKDRQF